MREGGGIRKGEGEEGGKRGEGKKRKEGGREEKGKKNQNYPRLGQLQKVTYMQLQYKEKKGIK